MTETISRLYQDPARAAAAVAALEKAGFPAQSIDLVTAADAAADAVPARISQGGVAATHVTTLADGVRRGATLVSVQAQFGTGAMATRLLEKQKPTPTGLPDQGYTPEPVDPAAPFSAAAGLPVLLRDPTPLSSALSLPVLSKRQSRKVPNRADVPAPFSTLIRQPTLTNDPAILSSRTKLNVLWNDPAPLSERLHVPVLTGQDRPAVRAGVRPDAPAPFSSLLGLKLLLRDPAPLSRLLGLRVLSDPPRR